MTKLNLKVIYSGLKVKPHGSVTSICSAKLSIFGHRNGRSVRLTCKVARALANAEPTPPEFYTPLDAGLGRGNTEYTDVKVWVAGRKVVEHRIFPILMDLVEYLGETGQVFGDFLEKKVHQS